MTTRPRRTRNHRRAWTHWGIGSMVVAAAILLWPRTHPSVDEAWLTEAIHKIQLSDKERSYERVLFSDDITETMDLASKSQRPILMFSNDGPLGRC